MLDLGTVRPGSTIRIPFSSFDKDDGSSLTMTNYSTSDILIYKDGSTTERASTAGFTATTDFDTKTGKHLCIIDLADNTTAGFWSAGSEYLVAIDAVTVDAVTTGGWIARFRIGYTGAILDTSIATLSTQTSFTLTAGPAEDDALNGMWVILHDVASAVQQAVGIVADYTGSTKTVTLAAAPTFTIAATDNFSVMGIAPLTPTVIGRTLDVSSGGEAGVDWANVGTPGSTVNLSATTVKTATDVETDTQDIQSRLPAALVGGRIDANAGAISGDATAADNLEAALDGTGGVTITAGLTGNVTGNLSGSVGSVTGNVGGNVAGSVGSVTGNVGGNVVGSVASVTGNVGGDVVGSVASVTGNVGGNVTGSVGSVAANGISASSLAADAGAEIADAVWDENLTGHLIDQSAADYLNSAMMSGLDIQNRLPAALVGGRIDANMGAISGDATAADNLEAAADGTGYNLGGGSVVAASVTGNIGGNVTGSVGSLGTTAKADVNAEVLDVLNVDTFAEPTTAPPATSSLRAKIGWIFKRMRNKETSSATEQKVYADDGTTVDSTATLTDSGGVFTRGEFN